jgi:uncharacterized YigZ family protein
MTMSKGITLLSPATAEIVEKKSRFIAVAEPVRTEAEALAVIERERKKHRDARHVCSAYYLDNGRTVRANDDGEPSGTAGIPILDLIKKRGLTDVVITVTRYFGGILLGAPGLVRAYSSSAKAALDFASLGEYLTVAHMYCVCEYKDYDKLKYLLESIGADAISPEFAENVTVSFVCEEKDADSILEKISDSFSKRITAEKLDVSDELVPIKG